MSSQSQSDHNPHTRAVCISPRQDLTVLLSVVFSSDVIDRSFPYAREHSSQPRIGGSLPHQRRRRRGEINRFPEIFCQDRLSKRHLIITQCNLNAQVKPCSQSFGVGLFLFHAVLKLGCQFQEFFFLGHFILCECCQN